MNWDDILGKVTGGLTNAAQDAASYALPALAGGIASTVMSAGTAALPQAGAPTATPIGVYSTKQMGDASANAPSTAATLPKWVVPAGVGALALVGVYLITRNR